jgi:hypothetical protein
MPLQQFEQITDSRGWCAVVNGHLSGATSIERDAFNTYWIVAGHHIRDQVADDRLLVTFLRSILTPYTGEAVTLYRGENLDRWKARCLGFAWTSQVATARMFGSGLNAVSNGGALLRATFPAAAIICGPNNHSSYLGEAQFTVDPFSARDVEELEKYAPFDTR